VIGSLQEFSKPQYCVDIFKVGLPVNMAYVSEQKSAESAYTREEAKQHLRNAAEAAGKAVSSIFPKA